MVGSLSEEMNGGEAEKSTSGALANASLPLLVKTVQPLLPAAAEADAAQASIARFKLGQAGLLQREANAASATADAALADAHGTVLENSQSPGKSIRGESGPHHNSEKKNAQTAPQAPVGIAEPGPAAVPQLPQPASTTAAQQAQGFLTEAALTAEHRTGPGLTKGIAPAMAAQKAATNGIATTVRNGTSPDGNAAGIAQSPAAGGAAHGASAHPQPGDQNSSAAGAAQAGLAPAAASADADAAANADADDSDAVADAAGAASASTASSVGSHTVAAADKRIIEQTTAQRFAQGAADATSTSLQEHVPMVQPAGDSSAFAREGAAGHATGGTLLPGSAVNAGAVPGSRETFAALDGDAAYGASWLHAGTHSAEAGFEDPALGWVSVRADMTAGGVHAAVVPGTAEAAQALGAHMAGLNSYLSDQRTPVHTLTLSAPGGDAGFDQGMRQGAGQNSAGQQTAQQPGTQQAMPAAQAFAQRERTPIEAAPITVRAGVSISLIA
jgi:hypothetical protein